jgi:hypothetical protein
MRWHSKWHEERDRIDYPVHEVISMWQDRVLNQLLSSLTMERLHDAELKVPADKDVFTTAELLERLTKAIFSEVDSVQKGEFTVRKPAITSLRRNLQRNYLKRLSNLVLGNSAAPQDCQTIAFAQLQDVHQRIKQATERKELKLDAYSKAHLAESSSRIEKVLAAHLSLARP